MTLRRRGRHAIGLTALLLAVSACGTTVPQPTSAGGPPAEFVNDGLGQSPRAAGDSGLPADSRAPASAAADGAGTMLPPVSAAQSPATADPRTKAGTSQRAQPRVTTPIQIGMLVSPSSAAAQAGLGSDESATSGFGSEATFRALVRYYNNSGGLGGRRIVPVIYNADASNSSYEADASAACATFTQDNHVAAVISATGDFWSDNYTSCLTKARVPHLLVSFGSTDTQGFADNPSMFATSTVSVDARLTAMIEAMLASRHLQRGDTLGVIVEACPFNERAFTRTLAPLAQREGLTVNRRDIDCILGYSDAAKGIAQVQANVLPYKTDGIKKILPVSGWETSVVDFFEKQAQSQDYQPTYFVSSAAQMASQYSNFTADALSRIVGTGWMPTTDVATDRPGATTLACRKILAGEGITAQNRADQYLVDASCDPFRYLDAALGSTSGAAGERELTAALESVGGRVPSSVTLDSSNGWSAQRHFSPQQADVFRYQPGCACFQYQSRPRRMP